MSCLQSLEVEDCMFSTKSVACSRGQKGDSKYWVLTYIVILLLTLLIV